MSERTLTLKIVTPEDVVVESTVRSVRLPGADGSIGVLPRHAPMVALTESGMLSARTTDGSETAWVVHDGFAEVRDDVVTVLTRAAEDPQKIDAERAREAARRARERLRVTRADIDNARAVAALRRALARERFARR
ncbi:MAG TPA: ATP synthase F1 subunit epsilon [Planctomycetota bacterium]